MEKRTFLVSKTYRVALLVGMEERRLGRMRMYVPSPRFLNAADVQNWKRIFGPHTEEVEVESSDYEDCPWCMVDGSELADGWRVWALPSLKRYGDEEVPEPAWPSNPLQLLAIDKKRYLAPKVLGGS